MNKIIITCGLLGVYSVLFADANIDINMQQGTILLNAPGTLTGIKKSHNPVEATPQSIIPGSLSQGQAPPSFSEPRYHFADEGVKFRQFGQQPGRNNPWAEKNSAGYPSYSAPKQTPFQTNPWQVEGMPSPAWVPGQSSGREPYSSNPYGMFGPGHSSTSPYSTYGGNPYSGTDKLYPDYPRDIYRDTNPANYSSPINSNFMPGIGRDKSGFPFSPFGLF